MKRLWNTYFKRFLLRALAAGLAGIATEFLTDQPVVAGAIIAAIYAAFGLVGPQEPSVGIKVEQ